MSSNSLAYNIYTDAGYTTIWGSYTWNGAGGPGYEIDITLNASGAGSATKTLYGVIPAGQQSIVPGSASSSFSGLEKYINYGYTTAGTCLAEDLPSTSSTGGFTVSATVPTSCSVSVTTLDFGSMSSIPSNVDVAATISPTCTNTTPYSLGIDNGLNASGAQRRMRLGATSDYLNYNLYTNSGRTSGWLTTTSTTSCTSGASTCVLGTGTGSAQSVSVYGRLPPQTPTAAGTYTDTAIVTLTY